MKYYDEIVNEYFEWLVQKVKGKDSSKRASFRKLLEYLHTVEFRWPWSIYNDKNRAEDGVDLRFKFAIQKGHEEDPYEILDILGGPCSVLEMMIALAIRCEEIVDDPSMGDRTAQWFWEMISNLGLGSMYDDRFDKKEVSAIIERFLDREYAPNGRGGLFRLRSTNKDLREEEIWYQMCWYLDSVS